MLVNLSKDQIYSLIVILEERVEDVNSPHSRGELQEIVNKLDGIYRACPCKEQKED